MLLASSKFRSIKPYLVNQFRTTFNFVLVFQVFWFVVSCLVYIWIAFVSVYSFVNSLSSSINSLPVMSYFFRETTNFCSLEFWSSWRVTLLLNSLSAVPNVNLPLASLHPVGNVRNSCQRVTVLSNFSCHCNFHLIISHSDSLFSGIALLLV